MRGFFLFVVVHRTNVQLIKAGCDMTEKKFIAFRNHFESLKIERNSGTTLDEYIKIAHNPHIHTHTHTILALTVMKSNKKT